MAYLIGLLTLIMVLDCLALVFLVLIQLPKKDAGAGLAFGAGATDALFGAGSGNVLTKITKYSATIFFVLAIILSLMQSFYHRRTASEFEQEIAKPGKLPTQVMPAPTPAPKATPTPPRAETNAFPLTTPKAEATNLPPAAPNNPAPAPK